MEMKNVIITGAAGLLGSHVVTAFRDKGYAVTAMDAVETEGCLKVDLTKLDSAIEAFSHADCVAHIASIPRPVGYEASDIFSTNMQLMFNVQAAMEHNGIDRLVFASSFSVLGLPFAPRPVKIQYFPVDERHPVAPQDVYAVTKWLGEEMVEAWVNRTGGAAASIRMPWIQTAASFPKDVVPRRTRTESGLDLWAYIDARDAASAFVAAAEADLKGHRRFFISAADTYSEEPTRALLEKTYPGVACMSELDGFSAVISNSAAEKIIGFKPEHSWREY
ncbi:MAG: NAD(P)-dependent oxidoreductase [Hoeflea sp.]|nr:NAD(P)-dependent oxidoreductase [Hoeflea sp.]